MYRSRKPTLSPCSRAFGSVGFAEVSAAHSSVFASVDYIETVAARRRGRKKENFLRFKRCTHFSHGDPPAASLLHVSSTPRRGTQRRTFRGTRKTRRARTAIISHVFARMRVLTNTWKIHSRHVPPHRKLRRRILRPYRKLRFHFCPRKIADCSIGWRNRDRATLTVKLKAAHRLGEAVGEMALCKMKSRTWNIGCHPFPYPSEDLREEVEFRQIYHSKVRVSMYNCFLILKVIVRKYQWGVSTRNSLIRIRNSITLAILSRNWIYLEATRSGENVSTFDKP